MSSEKRFIQVGDKVRIVLNEPWEILEAFAGRRIVGVVTDVDQKKRDRVIIHLDEELSYEHKQTNFFNAGTRYAEAVFSSDLDMGIATCNFSSLSDEEGRVGLKTPITPQQSRICAIGSLTWSSANVIPEEPSIGSKAGKHLFQNLSGTPKLK